MWSSLYEYRLIRTMGFTAEQFGANNGQANFGISPEQEEALYAKLRGDPAIGSAIQAQADALNSFTNRARLLLKPFQGD